jgi:hypothetical protein
MLLRQGWIPLLAELGLTLKDLMDPLDEDDDPEELNEGD